MEYKKVIIIDLQEKLTPDLYDLNLDEFEQ